MKNQKTIFTIGHSTHPIKVFLQMLKANNIELLVDVRHYPGSKHCPQFNSERLENSLAKTRIGYEHMIELGGRRKMNKDSNLNAAWRSPQFRGYADYMLTSDFKSALKDLIDIANHNVVAIMCAEALPWRCHRSMIADALIVQGYSVKDIFSSTQTKDHTLSPMAHIYRKKLTYPKDSGSELSVQA